MAKQYETVTDVLIDSGCTDGANTLRFGKHRVCKNGQRLWEMDNLIGLSGQPMIDRMKKSPDGVESWQLYYRVCEG